MVNIKFGQKHHCSACETRFYDLNQTPAICPKCSTVSLIPSTPAATEEPLDAPEANATDAKKEEAFFESDPFEDTRELDDGEDLRRLSSADSALLEESN